MSVDSTLYTLTCIQYQPFMCQASFVHFQKYVHIPAPHGCPTCIPLHNHEYHSPADMPSPPNVMHSISDAVCDNTMPGTADVTVSWQCPVDTGATVITGFYVSVNGIILTTASGTDSSYTIPGLALGETHDIAVAASNCLGTGAASQVQVALPGGKELCQCINVAKCFRHKISFLFLQHLFHQ